MKVMVLYILMLLALISRINIIMLNSSQKHMAIHRVCKKEKVKILFFEDESIHF